MSYEINIQRFIWNTNDVRDVSFFNPAHRGTIDSVKVNLWDYIKMDSLSPLTWEREELDSNETTLNYFLPSEIDFELSGIDLLPNGETVSDFFRMRQDTTHIRYKVEIADQDGIFWSGIVFNNNTEYVNNVDEDENKTLRVIVFGRERELMEFYRTKKLKPMAEVMALFQTDYNVKWHNETPTNQRIKYAFLVSFLRLLFDENFNVVVPVSPIGTAWHIVERPHLVKITDGFTGAMPNMVWYQNGYGKAVEDGETVWGLFAGILNSMGWYFKFVYSAGVLQLVIRDRSQSSASIVDINTDEICGLPGLIDKKTLPYPLITSVVIPNGVYFGGTAQNGLMFGSAGLHGSRCAVISNIGQDALSPHHISELQPPLGIPPENYTLIGFQAFGQIIDNNDDYFKYAIYNTIVNGNPQGTSYVLEKYNTLIVNSGGNKRSIQTDAANKSNFDEPGAEGMSATAMSFTGNYGSMLGFYGTGTNPGRNVFNYYRWCNSYQVFRSNWKKLLVYNNDIACEVTVDRPIKNFDIRVRLQEYNKIFELRYLALDLYRNETTLQCD